MCARSHSLDVGYDECDNETPVQIWWLNGRSRVCFAVFEWEGVAGRLRLSLANNNLGVSWRPSNLAADPGALPSD
jgi:hypothetical protein